MKRAVLAVGLVCLAHISLPASRQAAPQTPRFRSGVDLVHLDVSVLDRDRRPVRGLMPADFTILENGVPQRISVFTAVDTEAPEPPPAGWMREVAPDVRTNEGIEDRRLFLLIIDDAMIQGDPEALRNTRQIARQVIDRLGPSDLAAVVFTLDNRHSQDYTADRARLVAAIDRFNVGFRGMSGVPAAAGDALYMLYSPSVVQRAVEVMSTLADRRKSLIYIGQGVPVELEMTSPQPAGLSSQGYPSGLSNQGLAAQIRGVMERAFEFANRANVNIYTVDVCGLRAEKPAPPRPPDGLVPPPPTCQPGLEVDYLLTLAANTGARAVINTNEFEPGVQAIFDENASYYLLGYQPLDPALDGKFRRLEVRVARPGVEVRTRSGYRPEKPKDAARRKAEMAKAPLGAALAGALPVSDLPLQVSATPFPLPGKKTSAVAIVVGVKQPILASDERKVERVDLEVGAFNTNGRSFGTKRLRADVTLRAGATGLAEYEVLARLDLKPGRYQLRIAAHAGSLSTSGSLYYDVDVPDISKTPVSLSPVVLSVSPGGFVAPRDALADILPVVPTTRRAFTASDQVSAFARVYQRGKDPVGPITLQLRILDQDDRPVMDRSQDLPAAAFGGTRSADAHFEVPVGGLAPGAYLLTVDAGTAAAPVRRHVRFQIR